MKVTQITVSVHEKRNHPYEYGHYDAEVRLTADMEEGDTVAGTAAALRDMARIEVTNECDGWIDTVNYKRQEAEREAQAAWERRRLAMQQEIEDEEDEEDEDPGPEF